LANKPRILSISSSLRSLSTANRLRTLLIGGGVLLFVVAVGVELLLHPFGGPGGLQGANPGEAPNGKIAFVSDPDGTSGDGTEGIYVMDADGTNRTRLTDATSYSGLAWSPDGERLAVSTGDGVGGDAHIYVMNADGSGKTRLTSTPGSNVKVYLEPPVWSPDGEKIAFARRTIEDNSSAISSASASAPIVEKSGIYTINADGTNEAHLTNSPDPGALAWSPDGKKITYVEWGGEQSGGTTDIFVMNADGSGRRRLANRWANEGNPVWSPDGEKIAFGVQNINGSTDIFVMNSDGTGRTHLASSPRYLQGATWSPDGKKVAFMKDVTSDVYVMDADGTGKARITNTRSKTETIVAWSPEGDEILVRADDPPANPSNSEICLIDVDGSGRRCLVDLAEGEIYYVVAWARGGDEVALRARGGGS
jgi:Tol biopolymer transport system component